MARNGLIQRTFTYEGVRYYVSGSTELEAELNRELKKRELEEDKKKISKNMLVDAWCDEWLTTYKASTINARYYDTIRQTINKHISPEIGKMQIKAVKPVHLQKILNSKKHLSKSSVDKIFDIIRQIFREAYNNALIIENPATGLKKPAVASPKPRRPLTASENKATLSLFKKGDNLFMQIIYYCGLRPGEIAALQWLDIDKQRKVIKVTKALKSDGGYGPPKSKAGIREVPIPIPLMEALLRNQGNPFDRICKAKRGGHHTKSTINKMWEDWKILLMQEMNTPEYIDNNLTLYCYRHNYCTNLQAAGVPINVARELMGHEDITLTSQIYTHKSEKSLQDAADLINKFNASNQ